MQEYNFMPRNYKRNRIQHHKSVNIKLIIAFTLVTTILAYNFIRLLKMQDIEMQKLLKVEQSENQNIEVKSAEKEDKKETILTAKKFLNDINQFVNYSEVNINGNRLRCLFGMENEKEYLSLICNIEANKNYRVENISPLKNSAAGCPSAEVLLEVVK